MAISKVTKNTDTFISSTLEKLHLSSKEIAVYRACLGHNGVGVVDIMKIANLNRSTVYFVADQLVQLGLLRYVRRGAHRLYFAEHPMALYDILAKQSREFEQVPSMMKGVVRILEEQFHGTTNMPRVSYFQGQKEVRHIFDAILRSGAQEILFIGEVATLEQAVGTQFLKQWVSRRIKSGISVRGVRNTKTELTEPLYRPGRRTLITVRYNDTIKVPVFILISQRWTSLISSSNEAFGLTVESSDFAVTMTSLFQVLWKQSRRV